MIEKERKYKPMSAEDRRLGKIEAAKPMYLGKRS